MAAFHERFVAGAQRKHPGVDEALAERVWSMVSGFAGFGFPKAHGAAFGLLAYQSAWLREHHGAEFLCSLLDEQPMGFYPPDALVHEAQRRRIAVLAPDVNASAVECTVVEDPAGPGRSCGAVRLGLGYVLGVRTDGRRGARRRARSGWAVRDARRSRRSRRRRPAGARAARVVGRLRRARRLPRRLAPATSWRRSRRDVSRCGGLAQRRHPAGGRRGGSEGTQLALPLDACPARRPAAWSGPLDRWAAMIADYATTSLTTADHPLALLRGELRSRGAIDSGELERSGHGTAVCIGGLVVARQRPGTAKGVVFLLLEDELGTVNLIIPPRVYERDRLVVRTEPLVIAHGRLERHPSGGGAINVLVAELRRLDAPGHPAEPGRADAAARRSRPAAQPGDGAEAEDAAATGTDDFRAVAPPAMSFAPRAATMSAPACRDAR